MGYKEDFQSRTDLTEKYHNNSLILYALQLRFDISDIVSVASDSLTDGGNGKKCDLIYVDRDRGIAVIAQGYMKREPRETDLAQGNKASDLNTAAAWVFSQRPDDVPERIREQVKLLQSSIIEGAISTIYFWYVHNLNEANNPTIKEAFYNADSRKSNGQNPLCKERGGSFCARGWKRNNRKRV